MDPDAICDRKIKIKVKKRRNLKSDASLSIYFKDESQVTKNYELGKQKSDKIFEITSGRRPKMMEMIKVDKRREIGLDLFYDCLDIYNNNQMVLKSLRMTKANIKDILKLEDWFSVIPEPRDRTDPEWSMREKERVQTGISYYCDEDLRKIILKEYNK